jgi:hypothetical protein
VEREHDRIEELLAGYVLRSLSGEDAREADRLLSEHVPSCVDCRSTLGDFQAVMGELALGADPVPPPEILLPRLHRDMGPAARRRRPVAIAAAAASIVAVVGMAGLAVSQGIRASNADRQSALMREALGVASRPDANTVSLIGPSATGTTAAPVTEITAPGVEVMYLICEDVALPRPGMVYRIWFGAGGTFRYVASFEPDPELTVLRLQFDPATVDRILITEEPVDLAPTEPDAAAIRWSDAA